MNRYIIHTDGGSRGNPGPAALGYVIDAVDGSLHKEHGEYIGEKTNNEAEYRAVLEAMKKMRHVLGAAEAKQAHLDFHADSELLVKQMNGEYRVKNPNLRGFFMDIFNLKAEFGKVTFRHVYREENKAADRMVNQALDATITR